MTRKATYVHLKGWFQELRKYCEAIPVICVANKIDVDINVRCGAGIAPAETLTMIACPPPQVTNKRFKFPEKHKMPFFWVSAADGTNVVQARGPRPLAALSLILAPSHPSGRYLRRQFAWRGSTRTRATTSSLT